MKNYVKLTVLLVLTCNLAACTSVPPPAENASNENVSELNYTKQFDDMLDKDWHLTEMRTGSETITIDRNELAEKGFAGAFSLRFDAERISGMGAPNRYFAPYTPADNQAISIGMIAGTLMAAIIEPDVLKEHEYLALLQNVNRWDLADDKLELHSRSDNGTDTVLVFALTEYINN